MRRVTALVCSLLFVAAACSGDDDDDTGPEPEPSEETTTSAAPEPEVTVEAGTLTDRECGFDPPIAGTECSFMEVPENRADPDGKTVKLAVTVLRSNGDDPDPGTVVLLHGGPGGDEADAAPNFAEHTLRTQHDIVLYDQRGSGLSDPNLNCPEVDDAILAAFESIEPFETTVEKRRTALTACRDRLVGEGIDLNQYDSEASAADLESLRLALEEDDQFNLIGGSYGSRLALTYMRSFPDHVRSVLLDSVYPTDVGKATGVMEAADRALTQLTKGCVEDPACSERFPDFDTAIERAFERLNAEPYTGDVDLGEPNGTISLNINGYDAIAGLFTAMYDTSLIPLLPDIIEDVAAGDYSIIPAIAQQGIPFATQFAEGAAISIECADNAGVETDDLEAALADPGRYEVLLAEGGNTYCDLWDVEPTSPTFNESVSSDIPTLVFAGTYDPVTPPGDSKSAADALPAPYVEIDGVGHGVRSANACAQEIYYAFLAEPDTPPDTACAAEQPGPAWALG